MQDVRSQYEVITGTDPKTVRLWECLYAAIVVTMFFGWQYLPMQDYPDWIYQGTILKTYLLHPDSAGRFYHLITHVVPNAGLTVILAFFDLAFEPVLASKLVALIITILLVAGIRRYLIAHCPIDSVTALHVAVWCTFSVHFFMGYMHFLLGLAIAFHTMTMITSARNVRLWQVALCLLAAFFVHWFACLVILLFLGAKIVSERDLERTISFSTAALPAVLLAIWYAKADAHSMLTASAMLRSWWLYPMRLITFGTVLKPIVAFNGLTEDTLATIIVNALGLIFMIGLLLRTLIHIRHQLFRDANTILFAVLLTLIIVVPDGFGGLGFPAQRLIVACIVSAVVCIYNASGESRSVSLAVPFFALLALCNGLFTTAKFDRSVNEHVIPHPNAIVPSKPSGTDPYTRFCYYKHLTHLTEEPIFPTGLFTYNGADTTDHKLGELLWAESATYFKPKR